MNIQHSSRTDRWFTPMHIIKKIHNVLGNIDLDPASEPVAQERIRAKKYLTEAGESSKWLESPGTVYCNPPGGKRGARSLTGLFWQQFMATRDSGLLTHGIFMCFSIEALQSTQRLPCMSIGEFPLCIPKKRIAFDYPDMTTSHSPSHSNAIVYIPGTINKAGLFAQEFRELGVILRNNF